MDRMTVITRKWTITRLSGDADNQRRYFVARVYGTAIGYGETVEAVDPAALAGAVSALRELCDSLEATTWIGPQRGRTRVGKAWEAAVALLPPRGQS
jgi:hypothetical protein